MQMHGEIFTCNAGGLCDYRVSSIALAKSLTKTVFWESDIQGVPKKVLVGFKRLFDAMIMTFGSVIKFQF